MYCHHNLTETVSLEWIIEEIREEASRPPKIIVEHSNQPENWSCVNMANEKDIDWIIEQINYGRRLIVSISCNAM